MSLHAAPVRILGAGPTGALLAIFLQRQGHAVELFETRADPRGVQAESGRSINLALADRGIHALKSAGVFAEMGQLLLPMRGRLIHDLQGGTSLQPYGQRPEELIYSVSRRGLNQALIDVAARLPGVTLHFEHRFEDTDFDANMALVRDLREGRLLRVPMQPLLAADGAGSLMRRRLSALHFIDAHETDLEHGYKELSIPADGASADGAGSEGRFCMARDVLHIWPRGNFMLIALPNEDGSFTATLFLPNHGENSFASLSEAPAIERFFAQHFPDAHRLMPNCVAEFKEHPVGFLGTVNASPWGHRGITTLIGDSAHALVPFHGQGMNCCFEDCRVFAACAAKYNAWDEVFAEFLALRKRNTDAIAAMSLDNYSEMRERVADAKFRLRQMLSLELERRHPQRFIPRYSMVTFHHEISYATALERGNLQEELLHELTAGARSLDDVDFDRAARDLNSRLAPI